MWKRFLQEGGVLMVDFALYEEHITGTVSKDEVYVNFFPPFYGIRQIRLETTRDWVEARVNPKYNYLFYNVSPEDLVPRATKKRLIFIGEPRGILEPIIEPHMYVFYPEGCLGAVIFSDLNWTYNWEGYIGEPKRYLGTIDEPDVQFILNLYSHLEDLKAQRLPASTSPATFTPQPTSTQPPQETQTTLLPPEEVLVPEPYALHRYLFAAGLIISGTAVMVLGARRE